jgi:hypothetical protein
MLSDNDNLRVMQEVIAVLDQLGIAYALGGSWASSLLHKMRFTLIPFHALNRDCNPAVGLAKSVRK